LSVRAEDTSVVLHVAVLRVRTRSVFRSVLQTISVLIRLLLLRRQGLQEVPLGQRVEEALRRRLSRKGHRAGEDVSSSAGPRQQQSAAAAAECSCSMHTAAAQGRQFRGAAALNARMLQTQTWAPVLLC
jgi:hypothetical protein